MVEVGLWYGQAYVIDNEHRCILWTAFWIYRDTVMGLWGPLLCHSSTNITSCCSIIMHGHDLYTIPGSWKYPSSCMASILTGHVTHWACLGCSGSAYTTACYSSCQYPATSHSHWRGVDQHSSGHNQPDQLYTKGDVLHCMRLMVVTPDTDWFPSPSPFGPPQNSKTEHFRVANLRHTCARIMLSNRHLEMPHLWGGQINSSREECSLIQI